MRECFWFNLPGSHAPEIPDWHPCVVIRGARGADEKQHTVAIVPLTSREPSVERADIVRLSKNPNPIDDRPVWALCEFISTVALFRLEHYVTKSGQVVTPQISSPDLERILDGMVEGITLLKRRVESRIQTGEAKLKEDYEEKLRALEKEFEARVEAAMLERLELLTRPNPEPDGILASS
ncbi:MULTISPECIES: type II toxin-antitoxin system PemK/MazF family toxin [unclassified Mesorhizobium]|uniref:type II toxin-antitoxin system PemK/MazF family toxin n=2 Tax=Mesorhizobium TaxID=68287 RepID=UPI0013E2B046|nr:MULTISPECIES: type II toxin-antitoxin system PemK/MazF family toxin [unclassified Mesorhizobium]